MATEPIAKTPWLRRVGSYWQTRSTEWFYHESLEVWFPESREMGVHNRVIRLLLFKRQAMRRTPITFVVSAISDGEYDEWKMGCEAGRLSPRMIRLVSQCCHSTAQEVMHLQIETNHA